MRNDYITAQAENIDNFNKSTEQYLAEVREMKEYTRLMIAKFETELQRLELLEQGLSQMAATNGARINEPDDSAERMADRIKRLNDETRAAQEVESEMIDSSPEQGAITQ